MPAAHLHRRLLVACAFAGYAAVFTCFFFFERAGLGIGHFYYIPVALIALASGPWLGAGAGASAALLFAVDTLITPHMPVNTLLTESTAIRLTTFVTMGALIGRFASSNRALVERLRTLAERDFLTSLQNARAFDEALGRRCLRGKPFVLLLGDMDNLKEINDAHGHAEGNLAIRRAGHAIAEAVSPDDDVARVGGDEFAILTDAPLTRAAQIATQLQQRLCVHDLDASFGWAAFPEDGSAPLELFRKADDRLYAAKLISRNRRVVVSLHGRAQL